MIPLLKTCLAQFDDLRGRGLLFYDETDAELTNERFPLQFRIIPAISKKPWPGHEVQDTPAKKDPFGHPERAFVVKEITGYVVQLNKFCILKPQLLLHPKSFASQKQRLDARDFEAALEVMRELSPNALAFYNCRPEAGSSQPYKHVQIVLKPDAADFIMWPDRAFATKIRTLDDAPPVQYNVPYLARYGYIEEKSGEKVHELYESLLATLELAIDNAVTAHNVIFTMDWLCIIPRRQSGIGGKPSANSMGMMGMIWLAEEKERQHWDDLGLSAYLAELGYPPE